MPVEDCILRILTYSPETLLDSAGIPHWATRYEARAFQPWALTVDVAALSGNLESGDLEVLLVTRGQPPFEGGEALPGGFVNWAGDVDGLAAARRELLEETGLRSVDLILELGSYDRSGRDPRQFAGHTDGLGQWIQTGVRVVSRAFLALLRKEGRRQPHPSPASDAKASGWRSVYRYLPWEDLRSPGRRATIHHIGKLLAERSGRVPPVFDLAQWNPEETRARWEALREARLVEEAWRDQWGEPLTGRPRMLFGESLAFDHREMVADALGALRVRLRRDPAAVHALAGDQFRLADLQALFEAAGGQPLVRSNFRRLVSERGLVESTGLKDAASGPGKPAEFYRIPEAAMERRFTYYLTLPWSRDRTA